MVKLEWLCNGEIPTLVMESVPGADRGPRAGSPRGVVDATGSQSIATIAMAKGYDPVATALGTDLNSRYANVPSKRALAEARVMSEREFKSFADFWPYYLGEHSKSATRLMHVIGTMSAIGFVILMSLIGKWWLFPLALVPGY